MKFCSIMDCTHESIWQLCSRIFDRFELPYQVHLVSIPKLQFWIVLSNPFKNCAGISGLCVGWSTCLWTTKLDLIPRAFAFVQYRDWLQLTILRLGILFGLFLLRIWRELVTRGRICIWLPMTGGSLSRIQRYNGSSSGSF